MFFSITFNLSPYKPYKKLRYSILADELIFNMRSHVEFGTLVDAGRLSLGTVNPVNYVASADGEHYFVFSEGYLTETQMGSIHR